MSESHLELEPPLRGSPVRASDPLGGGSSPDSLHAPPTDDASDHAAGSAPGVLPARAGWTGRAWLGRGLLLAAVASLVAPIAAAGIWDPHEVSVADLARRIALNLFGGGEALALGADDAMPTRGELGRGELPFTSIAAGFRAFGLSEWAGRLPLALWAIAGVLATYLLVARLADRFAAALAALVLATMPLYFLHGRTMLGDIVTMAAYAGAYAGLGLACFDRPDDARRGPTLLRLACFGLGLLSLVAGFLSRGVLFGVAVPALGVGLSWLFLRGRALSEDRVGDTLGAVSLLLGTSASLIGVRLLLANLEEPERYVFWLGFSIDRTRELPTFDTLLLQLGHALFPWSALLPVAAARLFVPRNFEPTGSAAARRQALYTLALLGPALAYVAQGLLSPVTGALPFFAVAPLAVVIVLGLIELDRGADASRALAMVAGALAIVLLSDFENLPEKAMAGFVVSDARLPDSFRDQGLAILVAGTLAFAAVFALCWLERDEPDLPVFDRDEYGVWFRTLRELWNGNLLFGLLALEAALVGFVTIDWLGERLPSLRQHFALTGLSRSAARAGFFAVPALVLAPPVVLAARDCLRLLARARARGGAFSLLPERGALSLLAPGAFGLVLSLVYYPELGAHVSPKQAFVSFRRLSEPGEELAMIGGGAESAAYYAGRSVVRLSNADEAADWLLEGEKRRWALVRQADLGPLNAAFRERKKARRNLPVLDGGSSEVLLVSNRLDAGERNENPLNDIVLEQRPVPGHRVDASLGDKLEVMGWDVTDSEGRPVHAVRPGRRYTMSIYFEATAPVSGSWQTFIHIDGFQRRFNGDHPTLKGKYPFHLFRVGDWLADRHEFTLEPSFSPGNYRVYFGLFAGSRRMEVTRGKHDDDRIDGGALLVE